MNILIFAANWFNRGDESAIRAMIDELKLAYPNSEFKIHFASKEPEIMPYDNMEILPGFYKARRRNVLKNALYKISMHSFSKINIMPRISTRSKFENRQVLKKFVDAVKWCDLAIYAPGGPCIGELYKNYALLDCIDIIRHFKKPYVFFAPSMGPFRRYKKRIANALKHAEVVCFREAISAGYVKSLVPELDCHVTLDSAFQHPVDNVYYDRQFEAYVSLNKFLEKNDKVVGITITDLQWHSKYANESVKNTVTKSFKGFISFLNCNGYAIVFIPQLFGEHTDRDYMASFAIGNCFVVDDLHDCYFQQYLISKLYAVIGMRYHSNIFSAKMGTPFVSVAYEQKMAGFAEKVGLSEYCFSINDLSEERLIEYFNKLEQNYYEYKNKLMSIKKWCQDESYKTTKYVKEIIENRGLYTEK